MDTLLKQRIVGAIVLISLAVIFIPMLLSGKSDLLSKQLSSNIPPKPTYEIRRPEITEIEKPVQPSFTRPEPKEVKEQPLLDAKKSLPAAKKPAITPSVQVSKVPSKQSSAKQPSEKQSSAIQPEKSPAKTQSASAKKIEHPKDAQTTKANAQLATSWVVQVGSFSQEKNAIKLRGKIQKSGFSSFVSEAQSNKGKVYRVRVGPELKRSLADDLRKKMRKKFGLDGIVIRYP